MGWFVFMERDRPASGNGSGVGGERRCGRKDRIMEERIEIVRNIRLFQSGLDLRTFNGGNSVFTKILSPGSLAPFFHEGGLARFVRCCREGPVH